MNRLLDLLMRHKKDFYPVVLFNTNDRILKMDLTDKNTELTNEIVSNTSLFSAYIENCLVKTKALYGIGGYDEHRTIYSRSNVFDVKDGNEPRRLHLGTDIWGKAGTEVKAPTDGIVHSFSFNDQFGDYGATIILQHKIEDAAFYTLYGHLSLASIQNLFIGQRIVKGQSFASFGIPEENGNWPPHLHFQIIEDIGEWKGDYPGVCAFSQRGKYLANSPDPDLILQMNQYAFSE